MKYLLDNLFLVILCAGKSSRMGIDKALVSLNDTPWIIVQLQNCQRLGIQKVLLVTRPENYLKILNLVNGNNFKMKVHVICNSVQNSEMFDSMSLAYQTIRNENEGFIGFHTVDQKFPRTFQENDENLVTHFEWAQCQNLNDGINYHPIILSRRALECIFENKNLPRRLDIRTRELLGLPLKIACKFPEGRLHFNTLSEWEECQK